MEKKPTSKAALRWWGVSSIGVQLMNNMDSTFFTYFLTDVAMFPVALSGMIMTATSTIGLVLSIFVGAFIGMIKPMKWGRLRSYQLVLPPITLLFFALQYTSFGNGLSAAIFMIAVHLIGHFLSTVTYTADFAMVQEIAATPQDRMKLNSNRMVGSNIGRLVTSYAVPTFVAMVQGIVTEQRAYFILAILFSLVAMLLFFVHFKLGDGYENQFGGGVKADENLKIKDIINAFVTNKYLLVIILSDLSSNVGSFVIPALNVYYYKYVAPTMPNVGLATHLMCSSVMGLIGAYVAGKVGKKANKKKPILLTAYASVVGLLIVSYLVSMKNAYIFFVCQIIMQGVVGFTQPIESDIYMDVAVYHEWKTGKNCTAFIMGLLTIPLKISGVVKSFAITFLLTSVGYVAGMEATAEMMQGITKGYIQAPLIAPIIGIVVLGLFFNLNSKDVEKMQAEVNERRKQNLEESIESDLHAI